MNVLYCYVIPICLLWALLALVYWAIKLEKLQDYRYAFKKHYKSLSRIMAELKRKYFKGNLVQNTGFRGHTIKEIHLENDQVANELLKQRNLAKNKSTAKMSSYNDLFENHSKNSIDYTIKFNQSPGHNQNWINQHSPSMSNWNFTNSKNNLRFKGSDRKKQKIVCSDYIDQENDNEQTDYLKAYLNYQNKSKKSLVSLRNTGSNANIYKRSSISNICEDNGIRTFKDFLREGV